ncbi:MAG: preprotein translocase subunit SecG [Phycisphaerales bacterium JB041]
MDLSLGMLTLGASQIVVGALTVLFLFCSVLLILTVLIQRPQGGGLSGAFGGGGGAGGETAFGARTGDALTMATIGFFVLWLVIAVGLVLYMTPRTTPPAGPAATSNQVATPEDNQGGAAGDATQDAAEVLDADGNPVSGESGEGATDDGAADEGEAAEDSSEATDGADAGAGDAAGGDEAGGDSAGGADESSDGGGR